MGDLARVWDYDASVQRMRPLVLHWKNVTEEMLQELRRAKSVLSHQGARSDLVLGDAKLRTWSNYLRDVGLDRTTADRWLSRLSQHPYNTLPNRWAFKSSEWYTPSEYVEAARDVMGEIDLDPASSEEANAVVKARKFYSIKDDGLTHRWTGKVWMNPPYASNLIGLFVDKLVKELETGGIEEAIIITNNLTETAWWQSMPCSAVCFPAERIRFWHPGGKHPLEKLFPRMGLPVRCKVRRSCTLERIRKDLWIDSGSWGRCSMPPSLSALPGSVSADLMTFLNSPTDVIPVTVGAKNAPFLEPEKGRIGTVAFEHPYSRRF